MNLPGAVSRCNTITYFDLDNITQRTGYTRGLTSQRHHKDITKTLQCIFCKHRSDLSVISVVIIYYAQKLRYRTYPSCSSCVSPRCYGLDVDVALVVLIQDKSKWPHEFHNVVRVRGRSGRTRKSQQIVIVRHRKGTR
jgi:hypothetical protein